MHTTRLIETDRSRNRSRALECVRRLLLVLLLVTCGLAVDPARAQDERGADPLRAAVYQAEKDAATKTFLDPEQPKAARLLAAAKLGYPEDETFAAMLRIGADPTADDEIRWQALRQHRFDENFLDVVLGILEDAEYGGAIFVADVIQDLTRRTTFRLPSPIEQRIRAALRDLLDDPREPVRVASYRSLVGGHDTVAVNRLVEALNDRDGQVPVPLTEAIDLLDLDGSIYHIRTLQPFLDHADAGVQARAARALAVDPSSRSQIVDLARSRTTPEDVRLYALRALAREDEAFVEYAIELLVDREEDATIRHAAMKSIAGRMNYREVEEGHQVRFAEAVETLAVASTPPDKSSEVLQQEAAKLLAYLQKAFPAIELHYALR